MAAIYLAATFTPTPLDISEAEECMRGSDQDILVNLGLAVAKKLGRDTAQVRAVLWKTPRTVGMHRGPLSTSGRFIILRRHPYNVFESQFRVSFGENNRNPYRFAIFQESYEHAFARIPSDRRIDVNYDDLPGVLTQICEFLGVATQDKWESGRSNLEMAAKERSWMQDVTKPFENRDPEKRSRLDPDQVARLDRAMRLAEKIRPFLGPVRRFFDQCSVRSIKERARVIMVS
jgi:hypothetical protein